MSVRHTLFFHGTCLPNGHTGGGFMLLDYRDAEVARGGIYLGPDAPIIEAEYRALAAGLHTASNVGVFNLRVYGDSQLVVNHVSAEWYARTRLTQLLWRRVRDLSRQFPSFAIDRVPSWGYNVAADVSHVAASLRSDFCRIGTTHPIVCYN